MNSMLPIYMSNTPKVMVGTSKRVRYELVYAITRILLKEFFSDFQFSMDESVEMKMDYF